MTRGTPTRDARRMSLEPASRHLTPDDVVLRESTPDDTLVLDTFSSREVRSEHDYYDDEDLCDGHRGRGVGARAHRILLTLVVQVYEPPPTRTNRAVASGDRTDDRGPCA